MGSLFGELKRSNVIRVALAYIVTAWLLLQVSDVVLNNIKNKLAYFLTFIRTT